MCRLYNSPTTSNSLKEREVSTDGSLYRILNGSRHRYPQQAGDKEQVDIRAAVRGRFPGFAVLRSSHSQEVSHYGREDLTCHW
jgi:hypothetical protein